MWKPKHPAFKNYAREIEKTYKNYVELVGSREAIKRTAVDYDISETQIYRYLQFLGAVLKKTKRERDEKGRYTN